MLLVTTNSIDGKQVLTYCGVVASEVVSGANLVKDFAANLTDLTGGRSAAYEKTFGDARRLALELIIKKAEVLGANAILSIRFDYQILGQSNGMMMVAASGTAVQLVKTDLEKAKDDALMTADIASYYLDINKVERGPFSMLQLKELLAAGRIDENAKIRTDGENSPQILTDILR